MIYNEHNGGDTMTKKHKPIKDDPARPIYIYFFILFAIPALLLGINRYVTIQDSQSIFKVANNFQYVNRIVLNYNSETFEKDFNDYNFDELKTMLNPLGERSYSLLRIDMSELSLLYRS
jgi:hypothetical protein